MDQPPNGNSAIRTMSPAIRITFIFQSTDRETKMLFRLRLSLFTLLCLAITPHVPVLAQSSPGQETLVRLLAYGNFVELHSQGPRAEEALLLRLHRLPDTSDAQCSPETDAFCGWQYYLSVATYDEVPEVAAFRLPVRGEVLSVEWLAADPDREDLVRLRIHWRNTIHQPGKSSSRRVTVFEVTPHALRILGSD